MNHGEEKKELTDFLAEGKDLAPDGDEEEKKEWRPKAKVAQKNGQGEKRP